MLRNLEPRHLASFSACCSTARRLAASNSLWSPLYHEMQAADAHHRRCSNASASASATGATAGCASVVVVGVFKEKYRKRRADSLREQVWSARQKAATAEGAHTEALQQWANVDRAVHRTRGTVASDHRAKRQRLASGWHPAAVQRQFTSGINTDSHASAWVTVPTLMAKGAGSTCSKTEQMLRKLEIHSDAIRALNLFLAHSVRRFLTRTSGTRVGISLIK